MGRIQNLFFLTHSGVASLASHRVAHPPAVPASRAAGHGAAGGGADPPGFAAQPPELAARHEGHRQDLEEQAPGHQRRPLALVRHLHLEAAPLPVHRQPLQQHRTGLCLRLTAC